MGVFIRELLNMRVYKNQQHNKPLFKLANAIIMGQSTMSQKKTALRKIDEVLGFKHESIDETSIELYIAGCEVLKRLIDDGKL